MNEQVARTLKWGEPGSRFRGCGDRGLGPGLGALIASCFLLASVTLEVRGLG